MNKSGPIQVGKLAKSSLAKFRGVNVRHCERGILGYEAVMIRGWTVCGDEKMEETLFVRRDADGSCSYSLTNAPADATLEEIASFETSRFFVEHASEDFKSDMGWD